MTKHPVQLLYNWYQTLQHLNKENGAIIPNLKACSYDKNNHIQLISSTKSLFKILTPIFTVVKTGLQKYNDTCFSRSGINQM